MHLAVLRIASVCCCLVAVGVCRAGTVVWTGNGGSASWDDSGNWNPGVPQNGDAVQFAPGSGATISADNDIEGLTLTKIEIGGAGKVNLTGKEITLSGGECFTIGADCAEMTCGLPLKFAADATVSHAGNGTHPIAFSGAVTASGATAVYFSLKAGDVISGPVNIPDGNFFVNPNWGAVTVSGVVSVNSYKTPQSLLWDGSTAGRVIFTGRGSKIASMNLFRVNVDFQNLSSDDLGTVLRLGYTGERSNVTFVDCNVGIDRLLGPENSAWIAASGDNGCVKTSGDVTLTMNATGDSLFTGCFAGDAVLVWNPESDYTMTVSGRVHKIVKPIDVRGGRFEIRGSETRFADLTGVKVSAGAGFALSAECVSALTQDKVKFELATGANLELGEGVALQTSGLLLNGAPVMAGWYKAEGASGDGTEVAWITGAGRLYVPATEMPTVVAVWDAGAGSDTSMLNPLNWVGDVLPDFASAGVVADFSQAGSAASFATDIVLKGMKFGSRAFTLDGGADATLSIYQEGVEIAAGGGADDRVEVNAKVALMASQAWTAGTPLWMTGEVSSPMPSELAVKGGTVSLKGINTFTSKVSVSEGGKLQACGPSPFGESANEVVVTSVKGKESWLDVSNAVIKRPVRMFGNDTSFPLVCTVPSSNVFEKAFVADGTGHFRAHIFGGTVVFKGGVTAPSNILFVLNSSASGWYVIEGTAVSSANFYSDGLMNLALSSAGTVLGSAGGFFGAGTLKTTVPNAIATGSQLALGGTVTVDFCGCDQSVGLLKNNGTPTITSEGAATLTVDPTDDRTVTVKFTGAVSLVKKGEKKLTLSGQNEATGSVRVEAGILGLDGRWSKKRRSSNFTILDGAKLELAAGTVAYARNLFIGNGTDEPRQMFVGSYGSSSSAAGVKDDVHFAGSGMLISVGDGMSVIVR